MEGHVGIYVGEGKVIEATKAWEDKVVMSDISNTGVRSYHGKKVKKWISHGFLPYVEYNTYDGELPKLPKRGYFKLNDKGIEVKKLQKFLNWALDIKLDVDGIYGNNTKKAVKDFQKINSIKVDGLFGTDSLKKAKEYIK